MRKPFLWLLLILSCAACRARQTRVERWRSEIREQEVAARERLANTSDEELWERTRARVEWEYRERQRQQAYLGQAGGGTAGGSTGVAGLYIFDVSDLVRGTTDFAAPQIGDLRRPEDRGERGVGYLRESQGAFSEAALLEMITGALLPADFEERGGSVSLVGGRLIIREP